MILALSGVVLSAACTGRPEAGNGQPTLTAKANPSAMPEPDITATVPLTHTPKPSLTAEPLATATPLPTPTATPAPSPTPTVTVIPQAVIEVTGATLPSGFSMIKFADIWRPTSLAFDSAGRLYATSFDGTAQVFVDSEGDGRADIASVFFRGFNTPLGVTVQPGTGDVFVSSNGRISILRDRDGDLVAEEGVNFTRGLPTGRHQNDNLKFGPDGLLYIGVGSTTDGGPENDPRSATLMRFDTATGQGEVYASGLRNPYDLAFHPITGDLFATDNGRDDLGLEAPQEELNHIVQGGHYGFPGCWDELVGSQCGGTMQAIAFFEPRASANSMDFYTGDRFPAEYVNDIFVAVFGSFEKPAAQRGVARVRLTAVGDTVQGEVSWFAQWPGMPLGLITGPDGALYVGDYINGGIYRISWGN